MKRELDQNHTIRHENASTCVWGSLMPVCKDCTSVPSGDRQRQGKMILL